MAKDTYEHSTVTLSKKNFTAIMREIRELHTDYLKYILVAAQHSHSHHLDGVKNIRELNLKYIANPTFDMYEDIPVHYAFSIGSYEQNLIKYELFRGKGETLCKPRKSTFKGFTNKDKTFTIQVGAWATIAFNHEKNTIEWNVEEGNHSVDESRATFLGKWLFYLFDQLTWRKDEGGFITYWDESMSNDLSDEYCRESDEETTILYGNAKKVKYPKY